MTESIVELRRILLVEDSVNDIKLALSALRDAHLANEVVVVRDGQEALDYLHRRGVYTLRAVGNPAVVLLDLKLPKLNGLEVLQQIRAEPSLRHLPVVMITSSREEQDLAGSYNLGVNGYVVKPLEYEQFVQAIREVGLFWGVVNSPPPGSVGHNAAAR